MARYQVRNRDYHWGVWDIVEECWASDKATVALYNEAKTLAHKLNKETLGAC
jgi:hypothetical protein